MSVTLSPLQQQWASSTGAPLSGGLLYSFVAGTTTPLATYTDSTGLTPSANPIVLNTNGYAPVWLSNNIYKFVLYDSASNLQWSQDNIPSLASQIASISSSIQSVTMSYTQFQTAALSNAVAAFSLPANTVLEFVAIKHTTAFAGTSITAVSAQVGPSGGYTNLIEGFDVFQAVADQKYDDIGTGYIGSFANPTVIYLNMVATGANLSALSAGSVTVYYKYEVL